MIDRIRELKASGKKVALLALDTSAAFDLTSHKLILKSLEVLGAGPKMLKWTESLLDNCEYFVQIGDARSESWFSGDAGVGQGKQFSPELFNVGSITQAFWCPESDSTHFADDGGDVVAADTAEECQLLIQQVAEKRAEWFNLAGFTLNAKKSELIGFGFVPAPITIKGELISPSESITFLGLPIDSNLKWDLHIDNLCDKIRWQAGRIRSEGRHLSVKDKKILLHSWILSRVHFNALVYMPSLNQLQLDSIQTAVNAGIRAVYGLPRRSFTSISTLRDKLGIPSISDIREQILLKAAYRNRDKYTTQLLTSGPQTRSRSRGDILHPIIKGQLGKMSSTSIDAAWNKIPKDIRELENEELAINSIKALFRH